MTFPATVPKPMIAAINGACAGIGLIQALLCDVRFAGAGVKLTTAFSRRGIMAEHAGLRLPGDAGDLNVRPQADFCQIGPG